MAATTFFSYSRSDAQFALKIATDVREAGANIWLDQLDIPTGMRWDAEVEKALKGSENLLVILSPRSVVSNNVLDEISFALDENKIIIPVLMENCIIPFRIRRMQHIDFSKNYTAGFNLLLKALKLEKREDNEEEKIWSYALQQNTIPAFQDYLKRFANGEYKDRALAAINELENIEKEKRKKNLPGTPFFNRNKKKLIVSGILVTMLLIAAIYYINIPTLQDILDKYKYQLDNKQTSLQSIIKALPEKGSINADSCIAAFYPKPVYGNEEYPVQDNTVPDNTDILMENDILPGKNTEAFDLYLSKHLSAVFAWHNGSLSSSQSKTNNTFEKNIKKGIAIQYVILVRITDIARPFVAQNGTFIIGRLSMEIFVIDLSANKVTCSFPYSLQGLENVSADDFFTVAGKSLIEKLKEVTGGSFK